MKKLSIGMFAFAVLCFVLSMVLVLLTHSRSIGILLCILGIVSTLIYFILKKRADNE